LDDPSGDDRPKMLKTRPKMLKMIMVCV